MWADNTGGKFASTGENQFLVRATGGVGIGTADPDRNLTVFSSSTSTTLNLKGPMCELVLGVEDGTAIISTDCADMDVDMHGFDLQAQSNLQISTSGILDLSSSLSTYNSTLHTVNGTMNADEGYVYHATTTPCCTQSDLRLKSEVEPISDPLDTITRLRGVSFAWDHSMQPDRSLPDGRLLGFIAQEAREVVPEIVNEGADGFLSISYQEVIPILVEAMKEQQVRIEALQRRLEASGL